MSHLEQDYLICHIVEQLRDIRLQAGLSTRDIANSLHISEKRVMRWENSPTPDITFRQFTEYAICCGYMPRSLVGSCDDLDMLDLSRGSEL